MARKAGVRALSFDGLSFELFEDKRVLNKRAVKLSAIHGDDKPMTSPPLAPTLDEINAYIYTDTEVSQ